MFSSTLFIVTGVQLEDLFMAQNSFEALGEGGQPIWMVTTGVVWTPACLSLHDSSASV